MVSPRVAPGVIIIQPLRGWLNLKLNTSFATSLFPYLYLYFLPDFRTFRLPDYSLLTSRASVPRVSLGDKMIQPLQGWSNLKLNTTIHPSLLPYYLTTLLVFVFLPDLKFGFSNSQRPRTQISMVSKFKLYGLPDSIPTSLLVFVFLPDLKFGFSNSQRPRT